MTDHDRIDFSALDPSADSVRWEGMIRSVASRAEPALAGGVMLVPGPLVALAAWARPMLATAAMLAAVASAPLLTEWGRSSASAVPGAGLEEALQLTEPVSLWLVEDRPPTTSDLLLAVENLP